MSSQMHYLQQNSHFNINTWIYFPFTATSEHSHDLPFLNVKPFLKYWETIASGFER